MRRDRYTTDVTGAGGCETCGYGAPEYEDLDFDKLLEEIDTFGANLREEGTKP